MMAEGGCAPNIPRRYPFFGIRNACLTTISSHEMLKSKFRGCLLGSLLGDCLGAPFEGDVITAGEKIVIKKYLDKLEEPDFTGPIKQYTDDTAMMRSVARTLIAKPEPDYTFMAKQFVKEFLSEPNRGYGQNVVTVFDKLRRMRFSNVFQPALEQFEGSGSLGNGGAMRIAPIALYYHDNYDKMMDVATEATKITHTHPLGVNGALLQCMAVRKCMDFGNDPFVNPNHFLQHLVYQIEPLELINEDIGETKKPYRTKLHHAWRLLNVIDNDQECYEQVLDLLGNSISALESVPTAIFCFLRAFRKCYDKKNIFRETVEYAISLGGDTDTIASMAGALAGAYVGEENINVDVMKHCEKYEETIEMADDLLSAKNY